MPLYKQVVLTNLKATAGDVAHVFRECAALIRDGGGVVRTLEHRGERRLGYGIEDRRWGGFQRHYDAKLVVTQFNASPVIMKQVETKLKLAFPILRVQSFKVRDPIDAMMNTKHSMEEVAAALAPMTQQSRIELLQAKKRAQVEAQHRQDEQFLRPESFEDPDEKKRWHERRNKVPEWDRDVTFEPSPPDHLQD